jgi:HSP20 family protein
MSLVRYNPLFPSLSRWPSIWDDMDLNLAATSAGNNNLEVYETENEVVVKANVAGLSEKDVDLTFEKGVLWIKAEKSADETSEDKQYHSRSTWSYSYKVAVPGILDFGQEPKAEIENGVITVTFQKAEASKPKKLTVTKK